MNPEPPQVQPGYQPVPTAQAHADREVLTPNQRIVFFAAHVFTYFGWLIGAFVLGYTSWDAANEAWTYTDVRSLDERPSLALYLGGSLVYLAAVGIPLIVMLIVIKNRLRTYILQRPIR